MTEAGQSKTDTVHNTSGETKLQTLLTTARFVVKTMLAANDGLLCPGGVEVEVDPGIIRFTHQSISASFRAGDRLDDVISRALDEGASVMDPFPPMELVTVGSKIYSISNRRLFVFRCLVARNVCKAAKAVMYSCGDARLLRCRFDPGLGRWATKWERSFSTQCDGLFVEVSSLFHKDHFSTRLKTAEEDDAPCIVNRLAQFDAIDPRRSLIEHFPASECAERATVQPPAWNPASRRYGLISHDGAYFTKTARDGVMKLFSENTIRQGGRHQYKVSLLSGAFAATDGIGFVFSDRLGKDIQGIQSVFVNRRGFLCKRWTNGAIWREKTSCLEMTVGMSFNIDIDLDVAVARLAYKTHDGLDWEKLPQWDISDVLLPHRSGYFCVAFSNAGVTVQLEPGSDC